MSKWWLIAGLTLAGCAGSKPVQKPCPCNSTDGKIFIMQVDKTTCQAVGEVTE